MRHELVVQSTVVLVVIMLSLSLFDVLLWLFL